MLPDFFAYDRHKKYECAYYCHCPGADENRREKGLFEQDVNKRKTHGSGSCETGDDEKDMGYFFICPCLLNHRSLGSLLFGFFGLVFGQDGIVR